MVVRYIVTGTPGAGKTTVLAELAARGQAVVAEAATDVIARLHAEGRDELAAGAGFPDEIVALQRRRQERPVPVGTQVQLFDRSPVCTLALARYAGLPVSALLAVEVDRVVRERVYATDVFFVRPLGFVTPTQARRISYEQSLIFERFHEEAYQEFGFRLVQVPAVSVAERAALIAGHLSRALA